MAVLDPTLPAQLRPFFDGVDSIPRKNAGGCLVMCYAFWQWLLKNDMPTETFQIVQYGSQDQLYNNLKWLDNPDIGARSSAHFTWMYEGEEYDGEGIFKHRNSVPFGLGRVVLEGLNTPYSNLVESFCLDALSSHDWNYVFNRKAAVNVMEMNLGIDLSKVPVFEF